MSRDILEAVLSACARTPDAPAITFRRTTITYRDLGERVNAIAASLSLEGLEPGDRVLFSIRPGVDAVTLALGIITAGATVVFADPGAGETMFRARAGVAAPRWVAAESLLYAASSGPLRRIARSRGLELPDYGTVVPNARHIYSGRWLPGVPRRALHVGRLSKQGRLSRRSAPYRNPHEQPTADPAADPTAPALIIFTSGTTDDPKAVVHSRLSLGSGLDDFASAVGFVAGERVLTDQLMVGIPALISGAHWVMPPAGADPGAKPERYLDLLPGADVLFAVPASLDVLLRLLERHPEKSPRLRALLIGGAPVLRPLLERVRRQLPDTTIRAIYGMTEILPIAIADGDEKLAFGGEGDFVGQLMSSIHARVTDGELVVSGPGLASYLGKPPLTELATGDLARIVDDRVILGGRSKDMFIRGTANVYPGLYEPVIAGIPGVADAALVGVPNAIGDDRLVLALVAGDGFDENAVRRALPGLIDAAVLPDMIVVMQRLPRSGRSSKLDRAALQRQLEALIAEPAAAPAAGSAAGPVAGPVA